ncbi:hypothetical protein BDY17DRAFT_323301 [Neohortaea acidophila]|uniref:Uncharacterized protein n=1 Tax=Neohortaea acidophila TaxID=245834 RepID=A0A6A6PWG0_9PEZI|nr:uncharacterized protein BDY17DRAFT_323301 [Neohortaea acidophila]KAF2484450.1 hypothetical protein BDY17DRAFT_323301 [Neohortaea acidophila]
MAASRPQHSLPLFVCQFCRRALRAPAPRRFLSSGPSYRADDRPAGPSKDERLSTPLNNAAPTSRDAASRRTGGSPPSGSFDFSGILDASPQSLITEEFGRNYNLSQERQKPHRLHVYSHKHNTHLTLSQPSRSAADTPSSRTAGATATATEQKKMVDTLLSMSTGNIGFRKAGRGTYDAAFQLAAFMLKQIQERGIWRDMNRLEVVLRGFGAGRMAVTKALLGTEGRHIRGKITAVLDATRLNQGGARAKKPRRLG